VNGQRLKHYISYDPIEVKVVYTFLNVSSKIKLKTSKELFSGENPSSVHAQHVLKKGKNFKIKKFT